MKTIAILCTTTVVAMVIGVSSASAFTAPTVHRPQAEGLTSRALRDIPGWVYAQERYLDCRHGKINRTHWRCRFGWFRHGVCHVGRSQVNGESYGANGQPLFASHIRWRNYRCY